MTLEVSPDRGRPLQGGRPPSFPDEVGDHGAVTASSSVPSPRPRGDDGDGVVPQPRAAGDDVEPAADERVSDEQAADEQADDDESSVADEPTADDGPVTDGPPPVPVRPDVPNQASAPALSGAMPTVPPRTSVLPPKTPPRISGPAPTAPPSTAPPPTAPPRRSVLPHRVPPQTPAPSPPAPPSGATVAAPPVRPVPTARVYADGSALSRYLDGAPCRTQWLTWVADHEAQLITTSLGMTELRRIARPRGVEATGVAHDVEERVEVIRFSDQTLRAATKVSGVLPPFIALHIGAALSHPDVAGVATYDVQLAQVSALHGLDVVSPGWPARWWERAG